MKRRILVTLVIAAALAAGASQHTPTVHAEPQRSATQSADGGTGTAPALRGGASVERERRAVVLASVAGRPISVGDLEDAIANKAPSTRLRLQKPDERARFLEDMIRYDVLIHGAQERGYDKRATVIHAAQLAAIGQMQLRDLTIAPAAIPAKDVASYFAEHASEYRRPEHRRASLIKVASGEEARTIIGSLRGADRNAFSNVARERSTDERTADQGGELGYFAREPRGGDSPTRAPQAVVDAVFALKKVGDLTPKPVPIGDQFGVLMLTASDPGWTRTLKEVEGDIRESIAKKRSAAATDALVQRLRDEWKPEAHPELLGPIVIEPSAPPDAPSGFPAAPPDPRAPAAITKPDGY